MLPVTCILLQTSLSHFARITVPDRPGRPFLRRLIDLTVGVRRPHHRIRFRKETKHDKEIWLKFLREFNSRSFFVDDKWNASSPISLLRRGSRWVKGAGNDARFLFLPPSLLATQRGHREGESTPLELYTDAVGSKGYGAIFGPHWFFGSFTISENF